MKGFTSSLASLARPLAACAMAALLSPGVAVAQQQQQNQQQQQQGADPLAEWPEVSRQAAQKMVEKYGQPQGVTPTQLTWKDQDPWKAIIIYRDPVPHHFPKEHEDVLEQVISYRVPAEKFDELAEFDGSVIAERTKGTLAARCDKEPMNFLALNLAHDIVTDKASVEEARQKYAEVVAAFMKGDKHPYTEELQFHVAARGGTGDPDVAILEQEEGGQE